MISTGLIYTWKADMERRADEFSLSIRYRSPERGSYPRAAIPGFYLQAGFANEGEADWVAEDRLLKPQELRNIATYVDQAADLDGKLMRAINDASDDADKRRQQRISHLVQQKRRAEDELEALGIAPNTV
jgi:hypothetical protein